MMWFDWITAYERHDPEPDLGELTDNRFLDNGQKHYASEKVDAHMAWHGRMTEQWMDFCRGTRRLEERNEPALS